MRNTHKHIIEKSIEKVPSGKLVGAFLVRFVFATCSLRFSELSPYAFRTYVGSYVASILIDFRSNVLQFHFNLG